MRTVFREWRKDKVACWMMVFHTLFALGYIVINMWIISIVASIFDDLGNAKITMIKLAGLCAIQLILSMSTEYLLTTAINHLYSTLNNLYADKMLDADYEMFTEFSVANVNTTIQFIGSICSLGVSSIGLLENIITIGSVIIAMLLIEPIVVLPIIIVYIIGALVFRMVLKLYSKIEEQSKNSMALRNQEIENIIDGFAEVRSFNTISLHRESIHGRNKFNYGLRKKKATYNTILDGSIEFIDTGGLFAVLIFTIRKLAVGAIEQAQAMSLVMYVFRLVGPIVGILKFINEMSEGLSLKNDYDKIVSYQNKNPESGDLTLSSFNESLELKNVSFSYGETDNVINDINITIKKGERIGICGESGGGKSTLFKLINKFYAPSSGSISIDGNDIWDLNNDSFRQHIGSVHQETVIFPGTIRQNIMYGSPYASEVEFIEACKKARLYDFILGLPKKFETEVGPKGLKLSGGQKQRISLARLFLQNPDIILLDEATSALDNESETFVQEAIAELKGKTIITIAHRLSTIKDSDQIYILGKGGILEHGTHEELVKLNGAYAKMLK